MPPKGPPKGRTPSHSPRRRPRVAGLPQQDRTRAVSTERSGAVSEQWAEDVAVPASEPGADQSPARSAQPGSSARATGVDSAEAPAAMQAGAAEVEAEAADSDPERASTTVEQSHAVPGPTKARATGSSGPFGPLRRAAAFDAAARVIRERPARGGGPLAGGVLLVLLLLVTVVSGAAAVFFRGQAARAATGLADNRAVVDTAATSEVVSQVSKAIETVLSYDYTKLDENERASGEVITGKYKDEFAKTFADVRKTAPEQKLVLTTTVLLAGVTTLNDDRAELIATMDLAAVRDTTPYNSPGRVKVIATRVDGRWKITEMSLL